MPTVGRPKKRSANTRPSQAETALPKDMEDALNEFDVAAGDIVNTFARTIESEKVPEVIYHYTNDVGLRGILETGKLWLSDIFSLNDPSELRHGLSHAVNILNSKAENGPPEAKLFAKQFTDFWAKGVERSAHFFVLSFSSDDDDLGQWRAYADDGRGYALGFEGKALEMAFSKETANPIPINSTYRVKYDDDNVIVDLHRRIVASMFNLISLPRGKKLDKEALRTYIVNLSSLLSVHVMLAALFFKHKGYKNEKEFRFLQLFRADILPPDVKRRYRSYESVKYREFDWRRADPGALKRIIVGPAADPINATRFAEECLSAFDVGSVEVVRSDIPYRAVSKT
jgi:hypothetical protein